MTKKYLQLSPRQRYQIEVLLKDGKTKSSIGKLVGVDRSTIYRELGRNVPKRGTGAKLYAAVKAQKKAELRHQIKPKRQRFSMEMKQQARKWLTVEKLSPEFITVKGRQLLGDFVSPETIYQWIWARKFSHRKEHLEDQLLYKELKHGKRRRKRGNYKDSRGAIANRIFIDKRPKIVDKRNRLGDIEVDLIVGRKHQSGLLVTVDRTALIITLDKIKSKNAKHIKQKIVQRMKQRSLLKTMTFDNDQAFSLHESIAQELSIKTYFTRPYTSQDKGTIENRNGVVRRFFPKKTDFNLISHQQIKKVEDFINNRPVRKFKYQTPNQVFLQKQSVALIG